MKEIIDNRDNLKESDMNELVVRVKALILNSNNEILIAYSDNDYQFPGGHVEKNEELLDALKREIREETGIILDKIEPILVYKKIGYYKDHPRKNNNRKTEIYYYLIHSDLKPNLNNTSYTADEIKGNYRLSYYSLENALTILKRNIEVSGDKKGISRDMIDVINLTFFN